MDVSQITQRIAVANAESQRLNNERQVNIGKKSTLTNQLNEAIEAYSKAYGVELTVDSLKAELERVVTEKETEVRNLETVLGLIHDGKYTEAQALLTGEGTQSGVANTSNTVSVPSGVADTSNMVSHPSGVADTSNTVSVPSGVADTSNMVSDLSGVVEPPVIGTQHTGTAVPPNLGSQTASVPNLGVPPTPPKPKAPKLSGLNTNVDDAPTPPKPPKMPVPPVPPVSPKPVRGQDEQIRSFNAILGGSSFKPQG